MPKIKIKNIPVCVMDRICEFSRYYVTDKKEYYQKLKIDSDNSIIELSEEDFPTNREWLESLSNFELAALMTSAYTVKDGKLKGLNATTNLMTDINEVTDWLSKPCVYLMEDD